jgi:hypothetical protein
MEREIASRILDFLKISVEPEAREKVIDMLADVIEQRFGHPIYPRPGESLALSVMTPKTAALAFDRVYRMPFLVDTVPEELGFYCATAPEVMTCATALMLYTAEEAGIAVNTLKRDHEAQRGEAGSLRWLCSQFRSEFGISPTIFYHSASSYARQFPSGAQSVLKAAISGVALVEEANLTWDQVKEFRQDAEARGKYRRMVRWINMELANKSPEELQDIIAIRLDDYGWALKKHGIKSSLGALSCLLDPKFLGATSATVAAGALAGGTLWAELAGVTLVIGQALVKFGTTMIDGLDERRKDNYEIAYIHDIRKRFT